VSAGVALHDESIVLGDEANVFSKPISPAGDGGDEAMAIRDSAIGGERFPQDKNILREIGFFDEGVGPDGLHQLIFEDDLLAVTNENQQGVEGLQLQRNRLVIAQEEALFGIQPKRAELV
jgi:hypothetical protein